jgi:alpha-beta hydrolase superfamily lysophospholipase
LPAAAARGWHGVAVSLRGHGGSERPERYRLATLRHYQHDVLQAITQLPAPPVLIGHSMGGLVVQSVLERYRAAPAGVLVASAPPVHGLGFATAMLRHDPATARRRRSSGPHRPRDGTFFGSAMPHDEARRHTARLGEEAVAAAWQVALPRRVPDVRAPVLVLGGADDRLLSPRDVIRTARTYGTQARIFPGMGHDLMLGPGNLGVLDVMLDWLEEHAVRR